MKTNALSAFGLAMRGGHLVHDGGDAEACRQFVAELRERADGLDREAQDMRPYRASIARQNARAARKQADGIEATL